MQYQPRDACANVGAVCQQKTTIIDDTPPVITSVPADLDDFGAVEGNTIRTRTATDCKGAVVTDSQTVYYNDNTDPVIDASDRTDVTVEACDTYTPATPGATDNCDDSVNVAKNGTNTVTTDGLIQH